MMVDITRKGKRCIAKATIRSHSGIIEQATPGTIVFETENEGRQLILVEWDCGISSYAFAAEIEIVGDKQG